MREQRLASPDILPGAKLAAKALARLKRGPRPERAGRYSFGGLRISSPLLGSRLKHKGVK